MPLTPKQERFVEEYLIDLNGAAAARRAGYSERTAHEQAAQLLAKLSIKTAVTEAKAARSERTQIDQDWVIKRLAALADAEISRVMTWDAGGVTLIDSKELEWKDAYTINEVVLKETIKETEDGKELILNREKRVRQVDKKPALELLGKHIGMFTDKIQLSGDKASPVEINVRDASDDELNRIYNKVIE